MSEKALLDERGISEAYAAYGSELFGFAVRALGDRERAADAVQETFAAAWRSAGRFDPERGSLRGWLFGILRNEIVDQARDPASPPPPLSLDRAGSLAGGLESGAESLDRALVAWQVEEALRRIGEHHRWVLIETHFRGRSHAEVARRLGIPEGTVKSRVHYGLRALRNALEELGVGH